MLEDQWYLVRAKEVVVEQDPPPTDHPQYDRILAIQREARAKKLAAAKDHTYKMWGPQIPILLKGEPYEVLGLA